MQIRLGCNFVFCSKIPIQNSWHVFFVNAVYQNSPRTKIYGLCILRKFYASYSFLYAFQSIHCKVINHEVQ